MLKKVKNYLSYSASFFKEKIIPILIEFVKKIPFDINSRKYIILEDRSFCIPKWPQSDYKFKIFKDMSRYIPIFHYNPIERYIKIKEEIYHKENNVLIITDKIRLLKSFPYQSIKISPKILLDFYFSKKFNNTIEFPEEINEFSFLIWDSVEFIEKYHMRYKNKIGNNGFIEILFKELIEINEEAIFILKKLLFNSNLFFKIFGNNHLERLKIRIQNYLNYYFPKSFKNLIEKEIILKDFRELFLFLIITSYIKQFNKNLDNIKQAFEYINNKISLIQKLDYSSDIQPIFVDIQIISNYGDILIDFASELILTKNEINIKIIARDFNFKKIIKTIEGKIDLFEQNPSTGSFIFFPQIKNEKELIKKLFFVIPRFWISYNFLEYYIVNALNFIFNKPSFKNLSKQINLYLARNNKSIDFFKENVFYKLGDFSSEYRIKLNFLENFFEIISYLYYLNKDVFPNIESIKNDDIKWKKIFQKYIIPLNESLEGFIENSLQFIPSIANHIENYTSQLERKVFTILKRINDYFKEYLCKNYKKWVKNVKYKSTPINVVNAFNRLFIPNYKSKGDIFYLVLFIDCCHLNIWNILEQQILIDFPNFRIKTEVGFSILPTSTKYARVALFSGKYPKDCEDSNELLMFLKQIGRTQYKKMPPKKNKHFITNCENMFDFKINIDNIKNTRDNFQISIFNFSDNISHTYSQNFLKTLISSIYNTKIRPLLELVNSKFKKIFIFFATDHGSSRCTEIFDWKDLFFNLYWEHDKGDKNIFHKKGARTFISYKIPVSFNELKTKLICLKEEEPLAWGLPNIENGKEIVYFFANNYHNLKNTPMNKHNLENFGHGGSSMDEFIIPFAIIKKKENNYVEFDWNIEVESSIKQDSTIKNKSIIKITINNNSNKNIIFKKGHFITNSIHYKIILKDKSTIKSRNKRSIKFRLLNKYYSQNSSFYFTFYEDEKLEISPTYFL